MIHLPERGFPVRVERTTIVGRLRIPARAKTKLFELKFTYIIFFDSFE